jgi:hypothetical protein
MLDKPTIPGFLTETEQAARCGHSIWTLRRWRKRGYGPRAVLYGRVWLYPEDADARFLSEQAARAENQPRGRGRPRNSTPSASAL